MDIRRRISQANGAFATMKQVLCNKDIPAKLRVQQYDATVINILLCGCESWALTEEELQRKLEVCHHRFLRKMVGITIYEVKDNHISNKQVREELTCYKIQQSLELQGARWLKKLAQMNDNRGPRNALHS